MRISVSFSFSFCFNPVKCSNHWDLKLSFLHMYLVSIHFVWIRMQPGLFIFCQLLILLPPHFSWEKWMPVKERVLFLSSSNIYLIVEETWPHSSSQWTTGKRAWHWGQILFCLNALCLNSLSFDYDSTSPIKCFEAFKVLLQTTVINLPSDCSYLVFLSVCLFPGALFFFFSSLNFITLCAKLIVVIIF